MVPPQIITPLQAICPFYIWNESTSEVRWMTSFDTMEEDIHRFVANLKKVLLSCRSNAS
jgi:threonine aldolase